MHWGENRYDREVRLDRDRKASEEEFRQLTGYYDSSWGKSKGNKSDFGKTFGSIIGFVLAGLMMLFTFIVETCVSFIRRFREESKERKQTLIALQQEREVVAYYEFNKDGWERQSDGVLVKKLASGGRIERDLFFRFKEFDVEGKVVREWIS